MNLLESYQTLNVINKPNAPLSTTSITNWTLTLKPMPASNTRPKINTQLSNY